MSEITLNVDNCPSIFTLDILKYDASTISGVGLGNTIDITGIGNGGIMKLIIKNTAIGSSDDLTINSVVIASDLSGMFSLDFIDGATPKVISPEGDYSVNAVMGTVPVAGGSHYCVFEIDHNAPNFVSPFVFTLYVVI